MNSENLSTKLAITKEWPDNAPRVVIDASLGKEAEYIDIDPEELVRLLDLYEVPNEEKTSLTIEIKRNGFISDLPYRLLFIRQYGTYKKPKKRAVLFYISKANDKDPDLNHVLNHEINHFAQHTKEDLPSLRRFIGMAGYEVKWAAILGGPQLVASEVLSQTGNNIASEVLAYTGLASAVYGAYKGAWEGYSKRKTEVAADEATTLASERGIKAITIK